MSADPAIRLYWDTIIPPVIASGLISLAVSYWRSVRANAKREERERERAKDEAQRAKDDARRDAQITTLTETCTLLRGVLLGYDGKNGFKGRTEEDIRSLRHAAATRDQTVSNLATAMRLIAQRMDMGSVAGILAPPSGEHNS